MSDKIIKRILYVENDSNQIDMLRRLFAVYEFYVNFCRSSKEALQRVISENYDVVITDIGLFNIDGEALTRKIKEAKPDQVVIASSGHANINLDVFDGNWPKPVLMETLEIEFKRLGFQFKKVDK